VTEIGV